MSESDGDERERKRVFESEWVGDESGVLQIRVIWRDY